MNMDQLKNLASSAVSSAQEGKLQVAGQNVNTSELLSMAKQFAGGDHDPSHFKDAVSKLLQNPDAAQQGGVDESTLQQAHDAAYNNGEGSNQLDSNALGGAAAIGAMKNLIGGNQGQDKNTIIATAMSEAAKLYDQHSANGNIVEGSGSKDDAIAQAGMTAMKLLQQSGQLGNAANIASKFMAN